MQNKLTKLALVSLLIVAMFACSSAATLSLLKELGPAAVSAYTILVLSEGKQLDPAIVSRIQTDSANAVDLFEKYQAASGSDQLSALGAFNAAYGVLQQNLQEVFSTASVSDPNTQAIIEAVLILAGQIEAAIPGASPASLARAAHAGKPPYKNGAAFHKQFQALLAQSKFGH